MKHLRIIALMLVLAMCVSFAACADSDDSGARVTRAPSDTNSSSGPDFAEADYNQDPFTFMVIQSLVNGKDYFCGDWIDKDEVTGVATEYAVYQRNVATEEQYNVVIDTELQDGSPDDILKTYYMAGDYVFDVIYSWALRLGPMITDNYFHDFYDLSSEYGGYINFDADYWSPSAAQDLTIADKMYLCINDISMNKLAWGNFLFFNKNIVDEYNLTTPYDYVDSNTWTIDNFFDMVTKVSDDLDGDGTITKEDMYGLIDGNNDGSFLLSASDIRYTTKNENGEYQLNIYSDQDKVLDIIGKAIKVMSDKNYVKDYEDMWDGADQSGYSDQWEYARSFFATGHSLFSTGAAGIATEFKNMDDNYGVLPLPKYDSNQENYCHHVDSCAAVFALPSANRTDSVDSASYERTGIILEYMASKSNELLLPAYYDVTLQDQNMDDERDKDMLDIIKDSIRYEWTDIVQLGGDNGISKTVSAMFTSGNPQSTYDRQKNRLTNLLTDYYDEILDLE